MLIYTIIKYFIKFLMFLKNNILKVSFKNIIFTIFKKFFKYYYIFFMIKNLIKKVYILLSFILYYDYKKISNIFDYNLL